MNLLILSAVFRANPALWVRFLFSVLAAVVVGCLFTRWRRSELGLNEFCESYFFRSRVTPAEVVLFFLLVGFGVPGGRVCPRGVLGWNYIGCISTAIIICTRSWGYPD